MNVSPILPETIVKIQDFHEGMRIGRHKYESDIAAQSATTDEALDRWSNEIMMFSPGEYSPDHHAGIIAGYRAGRQHGRANNGGPA